jgi:transcriptional regulator with XRE-family HTH domain
MSALRKWREANAITQERLAELTGIPQSLLSKYEREAVRPQIDNALAIQRATKGGVPVESWQSQPKKTRKAPKRSAA